MDMIACDPLTSTFSPAYWTSEHDSYQRIIGLGLPTTPATNEGRAKPTNQPFKQPQVSSLLVRAECGVSSAHLSTSVATCGNRARGMLAQGSRPDKAEPERNLSRAN